MRLRFAGYRGGGHARALGPFGPQQPPGHRAFIVQHRTGSIINLLNGHSLDPVGPAFNLVYGQTNGQCFTQGARARRQRITGKNRTVEQALPGFIKFLLRNPVFQGFGNFTIKASVNVTLRGACWTCSLTRTRLGTSWPLMLP